MAGVEDAVADDVLLEMLEGFADLVAASAHLASPSTISAAEHLVLDLGDGFLAVFLLGDRIGRAQLRFGDLLHLVDRAPRSIGGVKSRGWRAERSARRMIASITGWKCRDGRT